MLLSHPIRGARCDPDHTPAERGAPLACHIEPSLFATSLNPSLRFAVLCHNSPGSSSLMASTVYNRLPAEPPGPLPLWRQLPFACTVPPLPNLVRLRCPCPLPSRPPRPSSAQFP
eukprot:EG_transcript_28311